MPVLVLPFLLLGLPFRLVNLLLLFLDEESLHGIVIVVVPHETRQLSLFRQHGSRLFLLAALILGDGLALPALHVLPADLELLRVLIVPGFVVRMVDAYHPAANLCAAEVVDC